MKRFTLLHDFGNSGQPPWPPRVPEARVSPPDDEPTGEELREALAKDLLRASAELRASILASKDPRLIRALEDFEYAWEDYQDECL